MIYIENFDLYAGIALIVIGIVATVIIIAKGK